MTEQEKYEYIQDSLRKKIKDAPRRGFSGKRGEGYEAGILAAMSKIKEVYGEE